MSTTRILVTGVGGFVGGHLARRIAERGMLPLGLGIDPPPEATLAWLGGEWRADLSDLDGIADALASARPDAIIHLAGQSSAAVSFEQPIETYRANTAGTWNLLEAVRRASPGARVLAVGTSEAYGPQPEGTRVSEDTPFRPVSPYALSKAAADTVAEAYARAFGLDVVRTRSFAHIGPGQSDRFVVPSVARQIAEIETAGRDPVIRVGNLEVVRDLTDVRDVIEAYLALLVRGRRGVAYNVCRGEGVLLAAVVRGLCERARVPVRIEVDPARIRPADVPYLVGDPQRSHDHTGWTPRRSPHETLVDVLDEWRSRVTAAGTGAS